MDEIECPMCGSTVLRYAEPFGPGLACQCRQCGTVWVHQPQDQSVHDHADNHNLIDAS